MAVHLRRTRPRIRYIVLALASIGTLPAAAQQADPHDTFNFGVGAGLSWDDNLLRLDDDVDPEDQGVGDRPRGTWINHQFVRAEMDLPISRQTIRASITGNRYRYDDYGYLNWEGVDYDATWQWEVGNLWEGDLTHTHTRMLSGLDDFETGEQNLQDIDVYRGRARYKFGARWAVTADAARVTIENDGDDASVNDSETNAVGIGLRYYSTPTNIITGVIRRTNGEYPNRDNPTAINDTGYEQNDYGVEVDYVTGPWRLEGGVAYTQRDYDNLSDRDFGGITANFSADWRITGKTGIRNSWRRYLRDIETSDATFILVNSFSVAPYWQVSDLVRVELPLQYSTREHEGDNSASGSQRDDTYYHIGFRGTWRPTQNWHVALAYEHIRRDSNEIDRDFDANTASVTVQFLF